MTKFEFFVYKLLGDATHSDGNGVSYWNCPWCGKDGKHFHTMLPHPAYPKNRVKCYCCGNFGDIHDLMRLVRGVTKFPREQGDLSLWTAEYEQQFPNGPDEHAPSSPRGSGSTGGRCKRCSIKERQYRNEQLPLDEFADDTQKLADAVDGVIPHPAGSAEADEFLTAIAAALKLLDAHDVHPLALASQLNVREWCRRTDREHMADCTDKRCENMCCRNKRIRAAVRTRRTPK